MEGSQKTASGTRPFTFFVWHHTQPGHQMNVVGSSPELGSWTVFREMKLQRVTPEGASEWRLDVQLSGGLSATHEYTFVVTHPSTPDVPVEWERCPRRKADCCDDSAWDVFGAPTLCVYPPGQRACLRSVSREVNPDGTWKRRMSNAVLCPLDSSTEAYDLLCRMQLVLQQRGCTKRGYALVPPSSLRVVIFDLYAGASWLPWPAIHEKLRTLLEPALARSAWKKGEVTMRAVSLRGHHHVLLEPADESSKKRLEAARNAVAQASGISRRPSSEYYIALAFQVHDFDASNAEDVKFARQKQLPLLAEIGEFDLPPPVFASFEDASEFRVY
eukprot:m51a1_g11835 hypothetical protein (330) ;mRNA; f:449101-450335